MINPANPKINPANSKRKPASVQINSLNPQKKKQDNYYSCKTPDNSPSNFSNKSKKSV